MSQQPPEIKVFFRDHPTDRNLFHRVVTINDVEVWWGKEPALGHATGGGQDIGAIIWQGYQALRAAEKPVPGVSDRVMAFARRRYESYIADLLDDPSFLMDPDRDEDPPAAIASVREFAALLGIDFEALVNNRGSGIEIKRLRDYETGVIKPRTPLKTAPD